MKKRDELARVRAFVVIVSRLLPTCAELLLRVPRSGGSTPHERRPVGEVFKPSPNTTRAVHCIR